MSSYLRTIYVGVTNNLYRRVEEHRSGKIPSFTKRYNIKFLVYFEEYDNIGQAIGREKEIKAWRREKKVALIESMNPEWEDLAGDQKCHPDPARIVRKKNKNASTVIPNEAARPPQPRWPSGRRMEA